MVAAGRAGARDPAGNRRCGISPRDARDRGRRRLHGDPAPRDPDPPAAAGTRIGRSTRTASWRRGFERPAGGSSASRRWRRSTFRATASARSPASIGATGPTGRRPAASTRRACGARTCSRRPWRSPLVAALLPKAPVRRAARAGLAAYGIALLATAASRLRAGARDACSLPVVLATMHLSWGAGFLVGARPLRSRRSARSSCSPAQALGGAARRRLTTARLAR